MRRRLIPADLYHLLLTSSWPRLLGLLAIGYAAANALFALGYLIEPDAIENARPGSFADAFFFSVQTMATIGYGRMVPRTFLANTLVTLETLTGLLGLAMVTGLVFAKFSRPTARVLFSRVAVIGWRDGVRAFMFRMANERGNNIVEAQVHVALARQEVTAEGESVRRFYDLELARRLNTIFPNTWTVIHPIVDGSPLHHATATSLAVEDAPIVASGVCVHSRDEEYLTLPLVVKEGLDRRENAIHIVDPVLRDEHLARMGGAGIAVDPALASRQLEVLDSNETYLRGGCFDRRGMTARVEDMLSRARTEGFPRVRIVGQMDWALQDR